VHTVSPGPWSNGGGAPQSSWCFSSKHTQNRDTQTIHLKLDELIRGVQGARNSRIDLEKLSDQELEVLQQQFERLRQRGDTQPQTRRTP
jgi:low affinity Fe/Cu permease